MLPEFLLSITSTLTKAGLDAILIGGWAVNHHGFHRGTLDIDFALATESKENAVTALASAGYRPFNDSAIVTRFHFREPIAPFIDLLWLDPATHQRMLESSEPAEGAPSLRIASLEDLLSMKLHALKQMADRGTKDLLDILTLVGQNTDPSFSAKFTALCEKFGPPGIHQELIDKWNL